MPTLSDKSSSAAYSLPAPHGTLMIYLEHDNHPAGAAYKFWRMGQIKNAQVGFLGKFLRANRDAQFPILPDKHIDTAYHYALNRNGMIRAYRRVQRSGKLELFYQGIWYKFVNKNLRFTPLERLYLFTKDENTAVVMALREAQKTIEDKQKMQGQLYNKGRAEAAELLEKDVTCFEQQRDAILKKQHLSIEEIKAHEFILQQKNKFPDTTMVFIDTN